MSATVHKFTSPRVSRFHLTIEVMHQMSRTLADAAWMIDTLGEVEAAQDLNAASAAIERAATKLRGQS